MKNAEILKRLERMETNASLLLKEIATLKEELSGGSDSSFQKPVLSQSQKDNIISKRRKSQLKKK